MANMRVRNATTKTGAGTRARVQAVFVAKADASL